MGAYDFMWNSIQAGQIDALQEHVKKLEKRIEILEGWIRYLAPVDFLNDKQYEVGDLKEAEEFSKKRDYTYESNRELAEKLERKSRSLKPGKFYPEAKDNDN